MNVGKLVSVLGLITALAGAASAQFGAIKPVYGLIVTFIGAMASTLGRAIVTQTGHWVLTVLGILVAIFTVVASQVDLFGPEVIRVSGSIAALLTALGKGFTDWWKGDDDGSGGGDLSGRPPAGNQYSL